MAGKACPRIKSKQWLNIVEKVGPFEAYRVFVNNGYEVPNFIFKTNNDVNNYLKFLPQLQKRKDKISGVDKWFIPYGRDYGTWTTNTSQVKAEVERINNIYGALLLVRDAKPSNQQSIVEKGRTKVEWVEVNPHALNEYYKIYEDPRELQKESEDRGEMYIPNYEQRVSYNLKVTGALMNIKDVRKTIRLNDKDNPYREKNLRKLLNGKGINDAQINFIFEYMNDNNIGAINTEDLAMRIASEFAYTVESNISIDKEGSYDPTDIDNFDPETLQENISSSKDKPTNYYANLSVPGGTNYTENEIKTPDITPSIKGHAEFSTDQGIGWFRNDEQRSKEFKEDIDDFAKAFGKDVDTKKGSKTRRILELQSDLFQKSRDKKDLISKVEDETFIKLSDNRFLQLLNKDSNWVTFFINTIIQDSAKRGYEKVLFPKGETAAKVEGHQTLTVEIKKINEELETIDNISQIYLGPGNGNIRRGERGFNEALEGKKTELKQRKSELKSQGIEKLKPIEAFYEIKVGNILKKIDSNIQTITDEYGNKWYEYTIKEDDLSKAFALQRSTNDKLNLENRLDFEQKKSIMLKTFPRVTEVIEDYNMSQAGVLESNGTVIKVNPNLWTTDTIGHEFGHLLIDIIGGLNNPLVQKARKQLLGSDIEVSVKERYADLVEAQDGRIDKEIIAQAIGEETAKIFSTEKDRAAWKNILTRILNRIKKLLHIETSAVKELAKKVLSGESINTDTSINIDFYESRSAESKLKENLNDTVKNKTKIEVLRNRAIKALEVKYTTYKRKDVKSKTEILKETLEEIKALDDNPIEGLRLFTDFAVKQTKYTYDRYTTAKRNNEAFLRGEQRGKRLTLQELKLWKDYVSGFALLEDLVNLAEQLMLESTHEAIESEKIFGTDETEIKENVESLALAVKHKKIIEEAYVEEGLILAAEKLSKFSKHVEADFNKAAETDYHDLTKEEKSQISLDDYKKERIGVNKEDIGKLSTELLQKEMIKASKDINMFQRWLESPFHTSDVVGSTMASAIVDAHFKTRKEYLALQDDLLDKVKNLESFYNEKGLLHDIKQSYDFMLEKTSSGTYTQHIVSPYYSSLWDNYDKFKKSLDEKDLDYLTKQEKLKEWKRQNMPLDSRLFNKAKDSFYEELITKGSMTKAQKDKLDINDHWETNPKQDISEIVSDEVAEIIHEWFRENFWKFRTPLNIYKNTQFQELVKLAGGDVSSHISEQIIQVTKNISKDPRVDFYNFITKNKDAVQKGTPFGNRIHTRLPSVLKSTGERAAANQSISKVLNYTISSTLDVMADEDERGQSIITNEAGDPIHFIPVYYTTDLKKFYQGEYDKLSDDKKQKISKTDYVNQKKEENQSYDLGSIYARYFESAINFKHKYEILPEMEFALQMVKDRLIKNTDVKGIRKVLGQAKKEKAENSAKQISDWFEASMYGISEKDQGSIKVFGGKVDINKAANALNSFTALNLLGLNFVQGTANALLGSSMQVVEAAGGEDYNIADLAKANVYYSKNLPGILGDIGTRKPTNIVSLLLRKYDILNEHDKPEFRKKSKFQQLLTTNTLFFTSQAGEHWMQTKVLLAMLNRIKAKDANGKELGTMLEMYSVENGRLVLDKRVRNFTPEDQSVFETRVRKKLSTTHGDYSSLGRVAIQRYAAGKMAYMFRKFIMPGVKKRYQKNQVDNALGEYVEGYYRSMGRFAATLVKDLKNFQFTMMSTDWQSLLPQEKANIRKALTELLFLSSAIVLSEVFIGLKEDGDDEDWIWSFLAYQSLRFKTELLFFSPKLDETMKILRSPAASMSVIENLIRFYSQLLPPSFEGFERYERGSWKGRYKITKTSINFVPGLKQIYRLKNIEDQLGWFN